MKAIIYTSNAGSTAQYAQLLANELHLPVYSAKEAKKKVGRRGVRGAAGCRAWGTGMGFLC